MNAKWNHILRLKFVFHALDEQAIFVSDCQSAQSEDSPVDSVVTVRGKSHIVPQIVFHGAAKHVMQVGL